MVSGRLSLGGSWKEKISHHDKELHKKKPYTLLVKWGPENLELLQSPCAPKGKGRRLNEKLN